MLKKINNANIEKNKNYFFKKFKKIKKVTLTFLIFLKVMLNKIYKKITNN